VFGLPVGRWSGPFRSGYGWHLVRVDRRDAPQVRPFADVEERVRADWQADRQTRSSRLALDRILAEYQVVRRDRQ
jgi:parvulin-like peptidyl-prolyl isomerase